MHTYTKNLSHAIFQVEDGIFKVSRWRGSYIYFVQLGRDLWSRHDQVEIVYTSDQLLEEMRMKR